MASPPGPGPSPSSPTSLPPAAHSRSGLAKYVKRISSVFKKDRPAVATASTPAPTSTTTGPSSAPTSAPVLAPSVPASAPATSTAPIATSLPLAPALSSTPLPLTRTLNRSAMQHERARTLFAKYGLTLESHEWLATPSPFPTVQRVEKAIRMRVHRCCHRCGALYGADKVCSQCEHRRCKKCPRFPKKKASEARPEARLDPQPDTTLNAEPRLTDVAAAAAATKSKRMTLLSMTTRSNPNLAHHPPRQRVRRICHKCDALFVPPSATACDKCNHTRCTKCPREPAKLAKWPTGYPGDAEANSDSEVEKQLDKFRRTWRKPRARVRWECDVCQSVFLNGSAHCPGCGHERCELCTRTPAKKVKKEEQFDPLIVAAVEAKLRAMAVGDDTTSSAEVL